MAGLWDRIVPGGENADRLPVHLVKAAIYLSVRGVFSNAQLLAGLNSKLRTPLNAAAQTDLGTLATAAGTGTLAEKIDYLERMDALNIAVEMGVLTSETNYRTQLGL